ncbi:unnamed protein product [Adineta ricciae]|uniref:Splicing factor YJU2 n=1 Tax=Adineta ricciae TaxID=249248 RepID=A0A815JXK3_ADIRI|nr:unnamed protein product [Adineta ricciae]CAF1518690.1 unnamed protein product [Adineta ricciae]
MSERKVLNKYYSSNFNPSKIPCVKRKENNSFEVRLMVPFHIRCETCGEYIYRATKLNARKEDAIGETYLNDIQIYRFYIRCTKCLREITFKTDPKNNDYELEHGATRLFQPTRSTPDEKEDLDRMMLLEKRTRDSRREMADIQELEDIIEFKNRRANIDLEQILNEKHNRQKQFEQEEDEAESRQAFNKSVSSPDQDDIQSEEVLMHIKKRKTTISFDQSNNTKQKARKEISSMIIRKKPASITKNIH